MSVVRDRTAMRTQDIEYKTDGRRMRGYLAIDDNQPGRRPAVLVCHEGPGLDDHARGRAVRLASLGYAAFALDYHGDGKPLPTDQMLERLAQLREDPDRSRGIARAGLDVLVAQPEVDTNRVAAIGYCFGGHVAIELARDGTNLKAAVGFHSTLSTARPAPAGGVRATILACIGADDPLIPPEQRAEFEAEMRAAGADWRMILYGNAMHSFTVYRGENPPESSFPGVAYHRPTDERSWRAMLDLFDEVL